MTREKLERAYVTEEERPDILPPNCAVKQKTPFSCGTNYRDVLHEGVCSTQNVYTSFIWLSVYDYKWMYVNEMYGLWDRNVAQKKNSGLYMKNDWWEWIASILGEQKQWGLWRNLVNHASSWRKERYKRERKGEEETNRRGGYTGGRRDRGGGKIDRRKTYTREGKNRMRKNERVAISLACIGIDGIESDIQYFVFLSLPTLVCICLCIHV